MHVHLRDMGREIERKWRASKGIIRHLWMPKLLTLLSENEMLPCSLQTLSVSNGCFSRFHVYGHMIYLNVSHMVDLHILICIGHVMILPTLPRGVRWFRYYFIERGVQMIPQENELTILEVAETQYFMNWVMASYGKGSNLLGNLEVLT